MVYNFKFDPKEKGLRQVLGDLEADIMEIVWRKKEATVREVHEELNQQRDAAYTTVMTVMSRLTDKGILRKEKSGSAFLYFPVLSKKAFKKSTVNKVLSGLFEDFTSPAINQFVDFLDSEDPNNIEELSKIIEEKKKKKNGWTVFRIFY